MSLRVSRASILGLTALDSTFGVERMQEGLGSEVPNVMCIVISECCVHGNEGYVAAVNTKRLKLVK